MIPATTIVVVAHSSGVGMGIVAGVVRAVAGATTTLRLGMSENFTSETSLFKKRLRCMAA